MNISPTIHSNQFSPVPQLGFGEKIPNLSLATTTKQKIHAIAVIILIGLAILAAGAILGAILTAPIAIPLASATIFGLGVASGAGLGFIGVVFLGIKSVLSRNKAVPNEIIKNIVNPQAPKLGEFTSNAILPTEHAKESSEWKLDLLSKAEQSIELSGNFCGGKLFREALDVIDKSLERSLAAHPEKKEPKLQVHITASYGLIEPDDYNKLKELSKKWPKNFHFLETNFKFELSPVIRNIENHVKLLVVDEKYFIVGGSGLQHEMGSFTGSEPPPPVPPPPLWKKIALAEAYRDMDFVGKGVLAKTLRVEFFKLWTVWSDKMSVKNPFAGYFKIDPSHKVAKSEKWKTEKSRIVKGVQTKALVCDPEKPNAITEEHIQMIRTAKKSVQLAQLTFNGNDALHDTIIQTAARGVDVSLVTNGSHSYSPWNNCLFVRSNYPRYLPLMMGRAVNSSDSKTMLEKEFSSKATAAKVYEYGVPRVEYHKKVALIDGETVIGGTYNISIKSHGLPNCGGDYEMALTMKSAELGKRVRAILDKDIQLSNKMTFDEAYNHYMNRWAWLHGKTLAYVLA